jgi:low temperature requirement protein LtrA
MEERGLMMLLHSSIIGVVVFLIMKFGMKRETNKSENTSLLVGAIALIYMILFGHKLPTKINKNLF